MDPTQVKTKLIGYGFSILEGIDPNPDNYVCAGIIHTKTVQIGCLLRLEPNKSANVSSPTQCLKISLKVSFLQLCERSEQICRNWKKNEIFFKFSNIVLKCQKKAGESVWAVCFDCHCNSYFFIGKMSQHCFLLFRCIALQSARVKTVCLNIFATFFRSNFKNFIPLLPFLVKLSGYSWLHLRYCWVHNYRDVNKKENEP